MKRYVRYFLPLAVIGLIGTGCFMGTMSTARTVGDGNVGLTGSLGYIPASKMLEDAIEGLDIDEEDEASIGAMQIQGRLDIGLSDSLDLGFTTGAGFFFIPYWTGAEAELKYAFVDDPDSVGLAAGLDFGLTMAGLTAGAALYLDSNLKYLPLHLSARPQIILGGSTEDDDDDEEDGDDEAETMFGINIAAGLHFDLSDSVRLLIEATSFNIPGDDDIGMFKLWNLGAGMQFVF